VAYATALLDESLAWTLAAWRIPANSVARIGSTSVLAAKTVGIQSGHAKAAIPSGGEIPSGAPRDVFTAMAKLAAELADLDGLMDEQRNDFDRSLKDVHYRLGAIARCPHSLARGYYRVLVTAPPQTAGRRRLGVISLQPLEADGLLRKRPLVFSAAGRPHEMQRHEYHHWTAAPPRILRGRLVDYLQCSGVARSIVTPDLRIRSDIEGLGRINWLERLIAGRLPPLSGSNSSLA
jgi:hypothetical protein